MVDAFLWGPTSARARALESAGVQGVSRETFAPNNQAGRCGRRLGPVTGIGHRGDGGDDRPVSVSRETGRARDGDDRPATPQVVSRETFDGWSSKRSEDPHRIAEYGLKSQLSE